MLARRGRISGAMTGVLLLLVALALEVVGCNESVRPAEWPELRSRRQGREARELRVVPGSNKEVADLSPDDIVRVCRQIGLSDEQILTLATDLHNALRSSGAAIIAQGKEAKAVLKVSGKYLFVRTPSRGSLAYNLARGEFGLL